CEITSPIPIDIERQHELRVRRPNHRFIRVERRSGRQGVAPIHKLTESIPVDHVIPAVSIDVEHEERMGLFDEEVDGPLELEGTASLVYDIDKIARAAVPDETRRGLADV